MTPDHVVLDQMYCSVIVLMQPMVFGAMMHRDEAFDAICAQYMQISTAAATITPET